MNTQEWEDLCDGCGQCCSIKGTPFACPELDVETHQCRSYENRHVKHPPCCKITPLNVKTLHAEGVLPWDCPYVLVMQGKKPIKNRAKARLVSFQVSDFDFQKKYRLKVEDFRSKLRPPLSSS